MTSLIVFTLGASIGSFINVVVYRLPAGLSLVRPRSRCPHCVKTLKPYDNLPILGWSLLKGRCRYCKTRISLRYPVVEALTAILFLLIFWKFQFSLPTIGYWVFCSWLLALSLIDLDTMTLPNPLTQSGLVLGILFQMVVGFMLKVEDIELAKHLMAAIVGAVLGLWLFDAIATLGSMVFSKAVMGGGDAKLAAMIGAWLGWKQLLLAVFVACVLGVLIGGGAIILSPRNSRPQSRRTRTILPHKWGQKMPFGPFLAFGAVTAVFSGDTILSTYWDLFRSYEW